MNAIIGDRCNCWPTPSMVAFMNYHTHGSHDLPYWLNCNSYFAHCLQMWPTTHTASKCAKLCGCRSDDPFVQPTWSKVQSWLVKQAGKLCTFWPPWANVNAWLFDAVAHDSTHWFKVAFSVSGKVDFSTWSSNWMIASLVHVSTAWSLWHKVFSRV